MSEFDKLIPKEAPEKTGINILLICDYNIAGHYTYLMRAINKYSPHKARCIIWHDDQFKYDKDIIIDELKEDFTEITQLAKEADFYYFGRFIFGWKGLNFATILNPHNCLIKYHGSFLRDNCEKIKLREMHLDTKVPAVTGMDWSVVSKLAGSFSHVHSFFTEFGEMNQSNVPASAGRKETLKKGDPILIYAGSGGHSDKQYSKLHKVVGQLREENWDIVTQTFTQLTHKEFIKEKLKAHLCFSSLAVGGWGLSGVESMFMGQPVLSAVDPWVLSFYPEQPCIVVNENTLYDKIKALLMRPEEITRLGYRHEEFAQKHFRTKYILKQHLYLIDTIREVTNIYEF